jgi:hypothetical protein
LVERFFAELTEKQIRRGSFTSVSALEKVIREYLALRNDHPKPFQWHKSAEEILARRTAAVLNMPTSRSPH